MRGIINVGGKKQSVYNFAKKQNESLKKAKAKNSDKLPLKQTMNLKLLKSILD